jgi:CheY-like chemotaxis protein
VAATTVVPAVTVVGPDRSFLEAAVFELRRHGLVVRRVEAAVAGPARDGAAVVLVDLGVDGSAAAEVAEAARAGASVVVSGVAEDLSLRSALVGAGAVALLDRGADPAAAALVRRLADLQGAPGRVGVLDDRRDGASVLAAGLAVTGLDVTVLDGPSAVMGPPGGLGALVVGGTMPPERVAGLIRLVRVDPRWCGCAVLALARAGTTPAAVGADDVMDADSGPSAVAGRVRALLRHRALVSGRADAHPPGPFEPPAPSVGPSPRLRAADPEAGPGDEVLVVEDDPTMAALLERVMSSRGWTVRVVTDGLDAAELLTDSATVRPLGLVLLDVSLPGLDGFGVLASMREAGTLPAVPVVVLTARSRDDEVVRALELGAADHVAKPVSVEVLLRRVDGVRRRVPA